MQSHRIKMPQMSTALDFLDS